MSEAFRSKRGNWFCFRLWHFCILSFWRFSFSRLQTKQFHCSSGKHWCFVKQAHGISLRGCCMICYVPGHDKMPWLLTGSGWYLRGLKSERKWQQTTTIKFQGKIRGSTEKADSNKGSFQICWGCQSSAHPFKNASFSFWSRKIQVERVTFLLPLGVLQIYLVVITHCFSGHFLSAKNSVSPFRTLEISLPKKNSADAAQTWWVTDTTFLQASSLASIQSKTWSKQIISLKWNNSSWR